MLESGGGVEQSGSPAAASSDSQSALETGGAAQEQSADDSHRSREVATALRNGLRIGISLLLTWSIAMIVKLQIPAHLGPVRQGHFAFAESFAMMFVSMIGLGVDTHVVKEVAVRPAYASDFIGGVFALRTLVWLTAMGAMAATLVLTERTDEILAAALVFGLSQYLASINGTLASVLQAVSNVGRLAMANVASKVIWGAGLMVGLAYQAPMWLLALAMAAAEFLKTLVLIPTANTAAALRYRIDMRAAFRAVTASLPFFVNSVAIIFVNYMALSALEFIRKDEREVGWFAASQNVAGLATLLIPLLTSVVMPMLSRAQARSADEMTAMLRRTLEGLLIVIMPGTVFISVGADFLIDLAFGAKFAPAALGLSILSLVFLMMYLNIMLASALILRNRGWSVTTISIGSVFWLGALMLICVPLGRHQFGEGGECAGAAIAVITSELFTVIAMLSRFNDSPIDARNKEVLLKSIAIALAAIAANHFLAGMGPIRLLPVMLLYIVLALALRVIQPEKVISVIHTLKEKGGKRPKSSEA